MYFRLNKINFSEFYDKFVKFYNDTNIIKIKIINKMKYFFIKFKYYLKIKFI